MKKSVILGLAALLAAPALAAPNSSYLPLAQRLYKQIMQEQDPSARQTNLFQGSAKVGETKTHQVQLTAGKYYTFFAACDSDCDNIDLTLKSADGSEVESDTEDDDAPMFSVHPTRTGRYTLSVTIPGCKTASGCKYSSQVFVGNRDIFAR
ncbi:hypothetical protein [Eikenella halliae]|uniref:hypothetical protein n=1 Tax=Eikenella halliae TaxID=1795832 RepID=UPI0036239181